MKVVLYFKDCIVTERRVCIIPTMCYTETRENHENTTGWST